MADPDRSCHGGTERQVLVADSDPIVRSALRLLLGQAYGLHTVSEASTAEDLLTAATTSAPGLVLLDWDLPGLLPDDALAAVRARAPDAPVVVLSVRPESKARALAAGADAFVCKADDPKLLLAALQRLLPGEHVSPARGTRE